jgi:hypothetical protein
MVGLQVAHPVPFNVQRRYLQVVFKSVAVWFQMPPPSSHSSFPHTGRYHPPIASSQVVLQHLPQSPKLLILYILCTTHTTLIIPCISPCNLSGKYPSPQKISVQLRPPSGILSRFSLRERQRPRPAKILLWRKLRIRQQSTLSTEHLDDPIAACADDPSAILAPDDAADTLAAHDAVACDFLCTGAFFEGPEAQAGIVAG